MEYNKINAMITDEWCKLIQNLILDGHCDEFDGNHFNIFVNNVQYKDGYDILFVSVSPLHNDKGYCLEVCYENKKGDELGFAPFNTLSIDTAINIYQQIKQHSGQFKASMINSIVFMLNSANIDQIAKCYDLLVHP